MAEVVTSNKKRIYWAVVLFFIFGFGFIPPIGQITPSGMRALGIFIGAVFGWSTIGILQPTLIAIFGFGLMIGFNKFVASSFGTSIIPMLLLLFPVCGMLSKYNVIIVMAQKFVTAKFCEGHPWRLSFMILLGAYVCSNISILVATILFIEFMRNICKISDMKTPNKWSAAMMIGVAMALMCGQMMIPVHGQPIVLLGALGAMTGSNVNYVKYILFFTPMAIIILFLYLMIMKYVLRIDVTPLKNVTIEALGGKAKFSNEQIKALSMLILLILGLIISVALPEGSALYQFFSGRLGLFGICLFIVCVLLFIKNDEGKPLFDFNECARAGIAWEAFFMVVFIVPFSSFLTGGETGISQTLASSLKPLFSLSPIVFMVLLFAAIIVLTNFLQNTVVCITFMPLLYAYEQATGFAMEGFYVLLFFMAQMAIATPGASTVCSLIYSSDLVDVKMVMKTALTVLPLLFVLDMLIGIPWALLLW